MVSLLRPHGGYESLESFKTAVIIHDLTVIFCDRYMTHSTYGAHQSYSRTIDQMVQAARSGKQNIAEASVDAATSAKMELKLLQVARGSQAELLEDYKDYLRQHQLSLWDKNSPQASAVRSLAYTTHKTHETYKSYTQNEESFCNCLISLINQACFLLDRQISAVAATFQKEGGFTERLYQSRKNQKNIRQFSFIGLIGLICLISPISVSASGISLTPAFQEVASTSASVEFSNHNTETANLEFSLAKIMATDLLGRFQFNAPLPQTIQLDANSAKIIPEKMTLNPGEIGTISATFNSSLLKPGTNAFLLLARIATTNKLALQKGEKPSDNAAERVIPTEKVPGTTLDQYLGATILVNAGGGSNIILKLIKSDVSTAPLRFSLPDFITLTLKNDGNARGIVRGVALVKDQFGKELMRGAVNEKSAVILPGSQRVIYASLSPTHRGLPLAWITFQLIGYDDQHQSSFTIRQQFLYLNPWMLLMIPIATIFVLSRKKHQR